MDAEARLAEIRKQQKVVDVAAENLERAKEVVKEMREAWEKAVMELGDLIRGAPLFDATADKGGDEA